MKMFRKFGDFLAKVLLLVLLFTGCTSINYQSTGKIPLFVGSMKKSTDKTKVIKGKKEFYLWGLYPKHHDVNLDQDFKKIGFKKINKFIIEEFQTTIDNIKSLASFGMYIPKRYKIVGHGVLVNSRN
jgi:hypothetical protein